jgi:NTE family protein
MSQNVALVLSSGGARGIAHIGVIEELTRSGYTITSVSGTSMGSIIGGMLANGKLDEFSKWLLSFTKMDVIKFLDLTIGSGGLIKGEKIMKVVGEFIGNVNIEDLSIPYACVASDLTSHKEMVFTNGNLLQAIRASSSIPTVFLPVNLDGMVLVDGGVLNPLPIDLVTRHDGDILIAVDVNANIPYAEPRSRNNIKAEEKHFSKLRLALNEKWSGMIDQYVEKYRNGHQPQPKNVNLFDVISESVNLSQNKLTSISIEKYKPDILVSVSYRMATIFDFYRTEELIEAGRLACRKALNESVRS